MVLPSRYMFQQGNLNRLPSEKTPMLHNLQISIKVLLASAEINSVIKQKQRNYSKKQKVEIASRSPQIQKSLLKDKYIEQSSISSIWLKKDSSWLGSFRKSKIKIQKCYNSQLHELPENLMNLMYQMLFLLCDKTIPKLDSNSPTI